MEEGRLSWGDSPFIVRVLALGSAAASIAAVIATIIFSMNANHLQRGDNTINVISLYGTEAVRTSRAALYDLSRQQMVDRSARALSFTKVAAMRGTLGVVATCYRDRLCLQSTIRDYFCVDVLKFDEVFGSSEPEMASITPDGADIAFGALVADCRSEKIEQ